MSSFRDPPLDPVSPSETPPEGFRHFAMRTSSVVVMLAALFWYAGCGLLFVMASGGPRDTPLASGVLLLVWLVVAHAPLALGGWMFWRSFPRATSASAELLVGDEALPIVASEERFDAADMVVFRPHASNGAGGPMVVFGPESSLARDRAAGLVWFTTPLAPELDHHLDACARTRDGASIRAMAGRSDVGFVTCWRLDATTLERHDWQRLMIVTPGGCRTSIVLEPQEAARLHRAWHTLQSPTGEALDGSIVE